MTTYANKAKRIGDTDAYNKWFSIVGVSKGYVDFIDGIQKRPDLVRKNHDYVKEKVYLIYNHSKKCTNLIVSESNRNEKTTQNLRR